MATTEVPTKVLKRKKKGGLTKTALKTWVTQWSAADREAKAAKARADEVKKKLLSAINDHGYEDDKGHRYIDLDEPIDGIVGVCRQLRVRQGVDPAAAEEFLKDKDLWTAASTQVRVLDESKLAQLVFEKKITQSEFESLQTRTETPAFVPVR